MSNQWFRLYTEIMNDPKVLALTEALRWRYVALLCLHNAGKYKNTPDDEIAIGIRITTEEWIETRNEFIKRRLLTADGDVSGWEKRQYISDKLDPTAAERQKRYRDKRNAAVTSRPPEADTDTDTEVEREKNIISSEKQENDLPELKMAFSEWNALASELKLPIAQMFDDKRRKALRCRFRECGGIEGWHGCIAKIRGSPFLRGERNGFNGATFDWITKADNFKKIMEGNYDDRTSGKQASSAPNLTSTERTILAAIGGHNSF